MKQTARPDPQAEPQRFTMTHPDPKPASFLPVVGRARSLALSLGLLLAALTLPVSGASAADWAHKKKIGLDTTADGANLAEEVQLVAVPVRLHSGDFNFKEAKPDGADLRFFAADGKTPLKSHLENYDAANELATAWVTLPKLAANSKTDAIVMAWGNDKATAEGDGTGGYDPAQIFVYEFPAGAEGKDASGNGNTAKLVGAKPQAAGQLGGSLVFDGSARLEVPASVSMKVTGANGFTFTAWLKPNGAGEGTLLTLGDRARGLKVALKAGHVSVSLGASTASAGSVLKAGEWQHLTVVVGAGTASFYLDGNAVGGGTLAGVDVSGEAVIGEGYAGELDEVGLAGTARTAGYVKALAQSQVADSPLFSVADDEGGGGEGASYFAILINSVTLDGWVVIGLLMVMFAISAYVMVSKALMLRTAGRANNRFLATFADHSFDMLTPGTDPAKQAHDDVQNKRSSVYRLYEIGLREVEKRFKHQIETGRQTRLSAAGLEAVRASLDAAMLRENQRFNSGMVLLTIAISGGPFLGLLGTVVGVMITFAAIAAAGEVNVNSIAPGVAAALVATVAGLGVAIPALFGYNWLASQIKNISSDTQVFVDEFITKSAELHTD
ncbi:MAG: DUF2341 domain-containing protein [Paucibacter sp.]|nr:DUF2341 domain-containing protein [Roseateles sp.]